MNVLFLSPFPYLLADAMLEYRWKLVGLVWAKTAGLLAFFFCDVATEKAGAIM
jgi:hypothetical protein